MCSGVLIVKQTGGLFTQPNDNEWTIDSTDIFTSSRFLHQQIQVNFK